MLYRIPAFGDRLSSLIDRGIELLFRLLGTGRKQAGSGLQVEQQSMKTLQQRIVQVPRDSRPLADTLFQSYVELSRQSMESQLIEHPKKADASRSAQKQKCRRLVEGRQDSELQ
jgi:ParB-like chromosome segregation protein Spo0J